MVKIRSLTLASALALSTMPALAHDGEKDGHAMGMSSMENMIGMHEMSVVVKAIDNKTGLMDVDAGGLALKVHFPPSTLKDVKVGDKINLHLGFSKS